MVNDYNFIVQDEPISICIEDQLQNPSRSRNENSNFPSIAVAAVLPQPSSTSSTNNTSSTPQSNLPMAVATTTPSTIPGAVIRTADIAYPLAEAMDIEGGRPNDPRRRVRDYPSQRQIMVFKWVFILTFIALAIVIAVTSALGATSG
eukprot:gene16678-19000_t